MTDGRAALRVAFAEVHAARRSHWGLSLHRGGETGDRAHDGRWDTAYSKTGYVVGGQLPGRGHGHRRFATLADVVTACGLAADIEYGRRASGTRNAERGTRNAIKTPGHIYTPHGVG